MMFVGGGNDVRGAKRTVERCALDRLNVIRPLRGP